MPPGPDPLHSEPLAPLRKPKRRKRAPKPSRGRVAVELAVVLIGLAAILAFVPLSSWKFPWVCGAACVLAGGYAIYGVARRPGAAAWWGFTWGGRDADDLAAGMWNTALLFLAAIIPTGVVRYGVTRPMILDGGSYLLWCVVQDFLFFSLILRGIDRLLDGHLPGSRHVAVFLTAVLFGLSHYPLTGFMAVTAVIAVCWGYIFVRTHLLWPITVLHFLLGLLVLS